MNIELPAMANLVASATAPDEGVSSLKLAGALAPAFFGNSRIAVLRTLSILRKSQFVMGGFEDVQKEFAGVWKR